jgi:hypothetical protein
MTTGNNRPKRPADVADNSIKVARLATGEDEDAFEAVPEKNAAAAELGRAGGRKRAEPMSPDRRAEIARKAAESRWKK